jgi:hypothetical protein
MRRASMSMSTQRAQRVSKVLFRIKTADSVCIDTKAVNIVLAALQEQIISKVLNSMLLL